MQELKLLTLKILFLECDKNLIEEEDTFVISLLNGKKCDHIQMIRLK